MKPSLLLVLPVLAFASCEHLTAPAPVPSTTTTGAEPAAVKTLKRPRVIGKVADSGFRESEVAPEISLTARSTGQTGGINFAGTARKAAKISIASSSTETMNLSQLVAWCETHDAEMRNHDPAISSAANSGRLPEENRNVSVTAWLHFAKPESDHDYHLIVGTSSNLSNSKFLNVEISGLPPRSSRSFAALKAARDSFEENVDRPTGSGYTQYEPTRVRIVGSLFYDIDHRAGVVGPSGHRPQSAWEIHPVTRFELANP